MLQPGDLERVGLPLGQLRLLQTMVGPQTQAPTHTAQPAMAAQAQLGAYTGTAQESPVLDAETRRLLGLGEKGEKVDYHKIRDYVTMKSTSTDTEEGYQMPDGSVFLPKGSAAMAKPKLENITALQYMEGSMRIMGKLILEGSLNTVGQCGQYAAHVAQLARLGQEKDWRSVVRYDDAYREAHVVQKLTGAAIWGASVTSI